MSLAIACDRSAFEKLEPFVVFESGDLSHGKLAEVFWRLVGHSEFHRRCINLEACYRSGGENLSKSSQVSFPISAS